MILLWHISTVFLPILLDLRVRDEPPLNDWMRFVAGFLDATEKLFEYHPDEATGSPRSYGGAHLGGIP